MMGPVDPAVAPHFSSAALLTIDTQTDTLDGEPLEIPGTTAAVAHIGRLCQAFRAAARPIVHVVRLYAADGSNAEPARRALVSGDTPILRPGTPGRLLAPGLVPGDGFELDDDRLLAGALQRIGPDEVVMYKPRWGAFFETPLHEHLAALGVDTVVVCGCNYPNCPRTSVYEASERDYRVVLGDDAVSRLDEQGRHEMANIGVSLLSTAALVDALAAVAAPAAGRL
jgi:nicotinamidase-related amidase